MHFHLTRLRVGWLPAYLLLVPSAVVAQTSYVDVNASGSVHDGATWCSAYLNLTDALVAASSGDDIRVAGGVYHPDQGSGDRLATFELVSGVRVYGGYAGCGAVDPNVRDVVQYETILSGDLASNDGQNFFNNDENSYHVVHYGDPSATGVVLDGFTVTAGNANGTLEARTNQGSGIHIRNNGLNCIPNGPTISNCTIRENWTSNHGAVNDHALNTVIDNCIFEDNFAGDRGGGMFVQSGSPTITNTIFRRNKSDGFGAGLWMGSNTDPTCIENNVPLITNCNFVQNDGFVGGGLAVTGRAAPHITDVTFVENHVTAQGAGAYVDGFNMAPNPTVFRSCLFKSNLSDSSAGAVNMYRSARAMYINSDFIRNKAKFGSGINVKSSSSATIFNCRFIDNGFEPTDVEFTNFGGAIHSVWATSLSITNSLFSGNRSANGGAIYMAGSGNHRFTNCTFTYNESAIVGGGIFIHNDATYEMVNSIMWGNTAVDQPTTGQIYLDPLGMDPCMSDSNIQDGWPGSCTTRISLADPMFVNAAGADGIVGTEDDDYHLRFGSPNIDTGDSLELPPDIADLDNDNDLSEPIPFDIMGIDRISFTSVDIGAFEFSSLICLPGTFSAAGEEPCTACPAGTFQPDAGGTECFPCPAGTFQSVTGAIVCNACGAGKFQPLTGQVTCLTCSCDDGNNCTTDLCDAIDGTCQPVTICQVPAASEWGLLTMALLLCTFGTLLLRHNDRQHSTKSFYQ